MDSNCPTRVSGNINDVRVVYEIEVAEPLEDRWSSWFDGLEIIPGDPASTLIRGALTDQAALFGLLMQVRDLGLTLLAVNRVSQSSLHTPAIPAGTQTPDSD